VEESHRRERYWHQELLSSGCVRLQSPWPRRSQRCAAAVHESGTVSLALTFGLISVSANVQCRLRLYASSGAASADATRTSAQLLFSTEQSQCICDITLNAIQPYIPAVSHTIHVKNGRATAWARGSKEPINVPRCGVSRKKRVGSKGDPEGSVFVGQ